MMFTMVLMIYTIWNKRSVENNEIHIITGISYRTFIMDKSLDHEWDNNIKLFMLKNNIEVEEI